MAFSGDLPFVDRLALQAFGITKAQAYMLGVCIRCKDDIRSAGREWSTQDADEYLITALCPRCFDALADDAEGLEPDETMPWHRRSCVEFDDD